MRIAVVGAGLIGCATALALARRGARVSIYDRNEKDAASAAAAGVLGAQLDRFEDTDLREMCDRSRGMYDDFAMRLDVPLWRCGSMTLAYEQSELAAFEEIARAQRAEGLQAVVLSASQARDKEPQLSEDVVGAIFFAGDAVVEPRQLLAAARRQCGPIRRREVKRLSELDADIVVDTAGAWATRFDDLDRPDVVRPIRGQIIELRADEPLSIVAERGSAYLSPRRDGRVLVGSTMEDVGFDKRVTAGAAAELIRAAIAMVPSLRNARVTDSWCGFRPCTADDKPILCRASEALIIATGHHRNGVLLAPITAAIVEALVYEEEPPISITGFDVARFH